jgi:hypothetical protein
MSKEVRLIATKDIPGIQARLADSGYRTRRLKAGDEFFVSTVMADLLVNGIKKAAHTRPKANVPPPSAALQSRLGQFGHADDLPSLRREYQQALGKRAFNGWDAATLREKIAAAK